MRDDCREVLRQVRSKLVVSSSPVATALGETRVELLLSEIQRLMSALPALGPSPELALVNHDAQALWGLLTDEPPQEPVVLETVSDRFLATLGRVAESSSASREMTPPEPCDRESELRALAAFYGEDADREQRLVKVTALGAVLCATGAVIAAVWGTQLMIETGGKWRLSVGPLLVCVAFALGFLALIRAVEMREREAREYRRLQRGLQGINGYLAPLPTVARNLVRATMTQVLFPRLLKDDDPLREARWPDPKDLLWAVYREPQSPGAEEDEPDADRSSEPSGRE
jgi:hypothetical protein